KSAHVRPRHSVPASRVAVVSVWGGNLEPCRTLSGLQRLEPRRVPVAFRLYAEQRLEMQALNDVVAHEQISLPEIRRGLKELGDCVRRVVAAAWVELKRILGHERPEVRRRRSNLVRVPELPAEFLDPALHLSARIAHLASRRRVAQRRERLVNRQT